MNDTEKDPDQLEDITEAQTNVMYRLIRAGKVDFEIHSTNPGHCSHDVSISVDHDELMEAIREDATKKARRKSARDGVEVNIVTVPDDEIGENSRGECD